ncbi:parasitic phase-specific protein PSP-1, partial [Colletotrichum scovillei]
SHSHFAKRRISSGPFAVKDSESTADPTSEGTTISLEASTQRGPLTHGTCTRAKNTEKSGRKPQNASCCEPCVAGVDSTGSCAVMMLDLEPGLIVRKRKSDSACGMQL